MSDQSSRQEQKVILADGGKPFASKKSAENMREALSVRDTHEVKRVAGGGWGLFEILKGPGEMSFPDETVNTATSPGAIRSLGPVRQSPKLDPDEKVYNVRFHAKSHPNDPDDVQLGVNGEVLVIKREEIIPLLERYIIVARNATYDQFRQLPGEQRKVVAKVQKFPFDILGESTLAEYKRERASGTKIANEVAKNMSVN